MEGSLLRSFVLVFTMCTCFTSLYRPASFQEDRQRNVELSTVEIDKIRRARQPNATTDEKAVATDICKRKCKQCFDGQACDFECVEKNCVTKSKDDSRRSLA